MATLANAGSTQTSESNPFPYATPATSENNPYQQALQGNYFDKRFAGVTAKQPAENATSDPNAPGYVDPASTDPSTNFGIAAQAAALEGTNYPTVAQSVAGTPEAQTKQQSNQEEAAQQEAAFSKTVNSKSKGATTPSAQQDINAALAPDQAILAGLPAEYKSTMAQLAPYIGSGNDTGNAALNAADENVASVVGSTDNAVLAGLQQLPKDSKEYAKSVSTQPIIQALLGFGKYEETYAGAQPTGQSNWSQQMDEIYKYLSGSNASNDGLGSPTSAASGANSSQIASSSGAGGGNA